MNPPESATAPRGGVNKVVAALALAFVLAAGIGIGIGIGAGIWAGDNASITTTSASCDVDSVNLLDFEVWKREAGYWQGNYTFLGADGNPFVSPSWNYPYDHYWGFISLQISGNALVQRNVFIYPPQTNCTTNPNTTGSGVCGVNGNERIFSAAQNASDCDGNLAGPYPYGAFTLGTTTTIFGNDTVLYQVKLPASFGGGFIQNQLTTLPGNDIRVRTAQGFAVPEAPNSASFYREYKLATQAAFSTQLAAIRAEANVLPSDYCAWDSNGLPSGVTCEEHFGFAI